MAISLSNRSCPYEFNASIDCWLKTTSHVNVITFQPPRMLNCYQVPTCAILWCFVIGFNHGVLGLAESPARGTGFWSQNTEGVARGVLTEKARPEGWVFSQAQHPMIKTYYSMSLHCNTAIIVFKLLAIVEWKRQRADIRSRHCC